MTHVTAVRSAPTDRVLQQASSAANIEPVYQPIVELSSGTVVAHEGLARWPSIPGAHPGTMFDLAREADQVVELDSACRSAVLERAAGNAYGSQLALFVNVEPDSLVEIATQNIGQAAGLSAAARDLRVVMELTERHLLSRPSLLLSQVARARELGWGIAMDDVGAHPDSLALLDLLVPDVIKLDLSLVQNTALADQARTLSAVMAHSERTGSIVLAEGIETEAHLDRAMALGATLGQGWAFGRPGPLPPGPLQTRHPIVFGALPPPPARTPFELVARRMPLRTGPKHLLLAFSRHIEAMAFNTIDPPVVLSTVQTSAGLTPTTSRRYTRLAGTAPLVAVYGAGLPDATDAQGYRTVDIRPGDPLRTEWTVIVLGAHTSAALIARDLGDDGPDMARRFEFVITYDRGLVTRAARSLTARLSQ